MAHLVRVVLAGLSAYLLVPTFARAETSAKGYVCVVRSDTVVACAPVGPGRQVGDTMGDQVLQPATRKNLEAALKWQAGGGCENVRRDSYNEAVGKGSEAEAKDYSEKMFQICETAKKRERAMLEEALAELTR